jgi:hypothetical protein
MTKWKIDKKPYLTQREVLIVAYAHLISGVDQQTLAAIYNVNQGRISEAVTVVRTACEQHMEMYRDRNGKEKKDEADDDGIVIQWPMDAGAK